MQTSCPKRHRLNESRDEVRKQKRVRLKKRTLFEYSERESNPHGHYWPQDFKSGVSTYSTIRALFCGANVQLKKQTAKCKLQNCEQKSQTISVSFCLLRDD